MRLPVCPPPSFPKPKVGSSPAARLLHPFPIPPSILLGERPVTLPFAPITVNCRECPSQGSHHRTHAFSKPLFGLLASSWPGWLSGLVAPGCPPGVREGRLRECRLDYFITYGPGVTSPRAVAIHPTRYVPHFAPELFCLLPG